MELMHACFNIKLPSPYPSPFCSPGSSSCFLRSNILLKREHAKPEFMKTEYNMKTEHIKDECIKTEYKRTVYYNHSLVLFHNSKLVKLIPSQMYSYKHWCANSFNHCSSHVVCSTFHNGSKSNFYSSNDNDYEVSNSYIEAQVVTDAVSILPFHGHLFMTLVDESEIQINHIVPPKGRILYRSRNPSIFLRIVGEDDLILPIIVGDVAVSMLMKALHEEENLGRPNQYHVMRDLVASLNYEVRMVRVTRRVVDTYHACIYIGRPGEEEMRSIDARPSDAVNLAVRCKVPIYVNKDIVYSDTVKPVYDATERSTERKNRNGSISKVYMLDRPEQGQDPVAEEATLMKNMFIAIVEERYKDAARWRDDLNRFRIRQHGI